MDEQQFDTLAAGELRYLEDQFMDVDPDDVEVSSSDGVLTLELRDGVRVIVNSHRAARQIWMAAVASAWHFDYDPTRSCWCADRTDEELRSTLAELLKARIGIDVTL